MNEKQPSGSEWDDEQLDPEKRKAIAACEAAINGVHRNETEGTFITGEALKRARDILREDSFLAWCRKHWKYDRTYAYKFMKVADVLAPFRERLVAATVPRAALISLSSSPEHVEPVLETIEAGEKLSGKDVQALIRGGAPDEVGVEALIEAGGPSALKALYRQKGRHIPQFLDGLAWITCQIEEALAPKRAGKRVLKGPLLDRIVLPARRLRHELESLFLFVEPHELEPSILRVTKFPPASGWRRLSDLLFDLGGRESWPPSSKLDEWLEDDVLPSLRWATGSGAVEQARSKEVVAPAELEEVVTARPAAARRRRRSAQDTVSASTHLAFEDFAQSALELDMARYRMPLEDVCDNWHYEVRMSGKDLLYEAVLQGDYWVSNGASLATRSEVEHAQVSEGGVRSAIGFMLYAREYGRQNGGAEENLAVMSLGIAGVFADLLVCGISFSSAGDRSASARRSIRNALNDDCIAAEG